MLPLAWAQERFLRIDHRRVLQPEPKSHVPDGQVSAYISDPLERRKRLFGSSPNLSHRGTARQASIVVEDLPPVL